MCISYTFIWQQRHNTGSTSFFVHVELKTDQRLTRTAAESQGRSTRLRAVSRGIMKWSWLAKCRHLAQPASLVSVVFLAAMFNKCTTRVPNPTYVIGPSTELFRANDAGGKVFRRAWINQWTPRCYEFEEGAAVGIVCTWFY